MTSLFTEIECPRCKQRLRIPTDKGRIAVRCPECSHSWDWAPDSLNVDAYARNVVALADDLVEQGAEFVDQPRERIHVNLVAFVNFAVAGLLSSGRPNDSGSTENVTESASYQVALSPAVGALCEATARTLGGDLSDRITFLLTRLAAYLTALSATGGGNQLALANYFTGSCMTDRADLNYDDVQTDLSSAERVFELTAAGKARLEEQRSNPNIVVIPMGDPLQAVRLQAFLLDVMESVQAQHSIGGV